MTNNRLEEIRAQRADEAERVKQIRDWVGSLPVGYPSGGDLRTAAYKLSVDYNRYLLSLLDARPAVAADAEQIGVQVSFRDEAFRLLTECCDTINQLADQQAMPDDFYRKTLESVGRFFASPAPFTTTVAADARELVCDWRDEWRIPTPEPGTPLDAQSDLIQRITAYARQVEAQHQAELIRRDGFMCETHLGLEFGHDPDCAGPGMPWIIEGREAVTAYANQRSEQRYRDGASDAAFIAERSYEDPSWNGMYRTAATVIASAIRAALLNHPADKVDG